MKVTKQETLYHEDYGATLKHKCGKRIVALSLLFYFILFYFIFYFFIWPFFLYSAFPPFFYLGQCSNNENHHTSIYLQLNNYNSILEQSMTLYECLRRCTGRCNEPRVTCMKELWTVALPQILCQLHDHAKKYDNNECVMINGMVESCMAIYLGMAMEMP